MKKTIKTEGEFSEVIPNPAGIPCKNKNSGQLRKEHDRWNNEMKTIPNKAFSELEYWENVSSCSIL